MYTLRRYTLFQTNYQRTIERLSEKGLRADKHAYIFALLQLQGIDIQSVALLDTYAQPEEKAR